MTSMDKNDDEDITRKSKHAAQFRFYKCLKNEVKIAWVLPRVSAKWRRRARKQPGEWRRHRAPGTMWPGSLETSPRKSRTRQTYEKRRDDILYRKTIYRWVAKYTRR